jgi:hypothetical protein
MSKVYTTKALDYTTIEGCRFETYLRYNPITKHFGITTTRRGNYTNDRGERAADGTKINADVNGALNIIKKAIPKAFSNENADEIEGIGLCPTRVKLGGFNLSKRNERNTKFVENGVIA